MTSQTISIDLVNTYHRDFSNFMENEKIPYSMKFILLFIYKRYFLSNRYNCDFLISCCNFDSTSNKLIWNRFHPYLKYIVSYNNDSIVPNDEYCRAFLNLFRMDQFKIKIKGFKIKIKANLEQIQQIKHHVFVCKSFQNITSNDLEFELEEKNDSLDFCKISIFDENNTQFVIGKTSQTFNYSQLKIDIGQQNETIQKMYDEIDIKTYNPRDNINGNMGCFVTNSVVSLEEY